MSSSLRENDIIHAAEASLVGDVSFAADEAGFLGVLKVEAVAFGDLAVDCLLDPRDLVNQFVAELVEEFDGKPVLGVDDPNEEEPVVLNLVKGHIQNLIVGQSVVGNGDSSSWIGGGEHPWRIARDDIKEPPAMLHLSCSQLVKIKSLYSIADRNGPELRDS